MALDVACPHLGPAWKQLAHQAERARIRGSRAFSGLSMGPREDERFYDRAWATDWAWSSKTQSQGPERARVLRYRARAPERARSCTTKSQGLTTTSETHIKIGRNLRGCSLGNRIRPGKQIEISSPCHQSSLFF